MQRTGLPACLSILAMSTAHAAQPLVTDDAATVAAKTCQVETWMSIANDGRAYWVQPACSFVDSLELSIGGARVRPDDDRASDSVLVQGKTVVFRDGSDRGSIGFVAGAIRETSTPHGRSSFETYYAKALATWLPASAVEIDANLGAENVYGIGTFMLAGIAVQYAVVPRLQLLAEAFRDQPGHPGYQVGARWIVIPDRFEAFVGGAKRFESSVVPWSVVIGIRLQSNPVFP